MKKFQILFLILIGVLISRLSMSQERNAMSLTLENCIAMALKNNLKIAVEMYNPEIADASLTRAKEVFLPRLDFNYNKQKTEMPSYWWIQGSETVRDRQSDYLFSLSQRIPTGGDLSVSLSGYKINTNQAFQLINPRYGNSLRLEFRQPLLKGFGLKIGQKEILLARHSLEMSQQQFETVLQDTVYRVREAYWNLVYAIENHKVKQQSLRLAQDLLSKNRKEVEVGKLAEIEILNAETVVASREADILQAEALIRKNEDILKNIINLTGEEPGVNLVPLDQPIFERKDLSKEELLDQALSNRPELKMNRENVESKELSFHIAKNQMLPGLDLNLSYWSPGVSGDRLIYLNDNPFLGIIVGKEKGGGSDSLRDAFQMLYKNWSVSLTLSFPLSNVLTRAECHLARMEKEKSLLELENLEKQVFLEVKNVLRDIETNAKRVEAYRLARDLAEKRLRAEEKKLAVGLTTNYFVLEYQEKLATSKSQEILALIDYRLALARLDKAIGTSIQ